MSVMTILSVIFGGRHGPPKGEINSVVSQAMQEHEAAIAYFNRVACGIEHRPGCNCYIDGHRVVTAPETSDDLGG